MKKLIALTAVAALMSGVSLASFAAEKTHEEMCKEQAAKKHVSADKLDAFVKTCVEKHAKGAMSAPAGAPAAPTAPPVAK
ncbi:MAG: hypothetical protein AABZ84_09195 [Pseudomonadota bacterium]